MTLLVSWVGVDSHGPASVYLASDSRLSWGADCYFDQGRKVFAFRTSPDIVGYCGDVLFPSMAISQAIALANNGLLFSQSNTCLERFELFRTQIKGHFQQYPTEHGVLSGNMFQMVFASRDRVNPRSFACFQLDWRKDTGWRTTKLALPAQSAVTASLGSGGTYFDQNLTQYDTGPNQSTSRNVFHCFCETLFSAVDPYCGGSPQLVGLYCKPNSLAKQFGIIRSGYRYLNGMRITNAPSFTSVEWRNDLFERCDGQTMLRLDGAMPQPDVLRTST